MWTRKDWVCSAVYAFAAFAVTVGAFLSASAVADGPTTRAIVIDKPALTFDGLSITASLQHAGIGPPDNAGGLVKPGAFPAMELKVANTTEQEASARFSAEIFESRIANPASRVPMPRKSTPKSEWAKTFEIGLQPGETKLVQIRPDIPLPAMSSATLRLESNAQNVDVQHLDSQTVDALTFSTTPSAPALTATR